MFADKDLKTISIKKLESLHKQNNYSIVKYAILNKNICFVEWLGIKEALFRLVMIDTVKKNVHILGVGSDLPGLIKIFEKQCDLNKLCNLIEKDNKKESVICPVCFKKMVVRWGKWGMFYACPTKNCGCTASAEGNYSQKTLAAIENKKKIKKEEFTNRYNNINDDT